VPARYIHTYMNQNSDWTASVDTPLICNEHPLNHHYYTLHDVFQNIVNTSWPISISKGSFN